MGAFFSLDSSFFAIAFDEIGIKKEAKQQPMNKTARNVNLIVKKCNRAIDVLKIGIISEFNYFF